ncbi:ATP-binding protein [Porcipelethomonas ammoniilytica]|uniref:AAA family ATPase n=1 Tax=Porcipelethomonas ammoniilytica TaxID=2981722 RepID=UPI0008233E27|nr:AAA family ATPase [Porcipelethomonas ammoniilytica]MCU6720419.1 ATP-binding protein [Porcipelethomonas ammoniilytica]SCJ12385.1 Predicted AAA-ATPase [uncultured Ruminococcus sp.]
MGIYLNPSNIDFQQALNSKIYVDKSMLIDYSNSVIYTEQKFICVSRPRRFGKSMAANMLTAYYSRGCNSDEMFSNLKISRADTFEKHLNKYNVIHINMVNFLSESQNMDEMIEFIEEDLIDELKNEYPDIRYPKRQNLIKIIAAIFSQTYIPFIFIIDEWDCIFREHQNDTDAQKKYLDFLRNLLKDQSYVALAYMTGILPIKKYGKHSALNMFTEVSMTDPREYAEFTGFTESEVKQLCNEYKMPFDETKRWYDGYNLMGVSAYNPRSVVMSMTGGYFNNYWTSTETYEALRVYIEMNFGGLKDTIIELLAGQKAVIDTTTFSNDMVTFETKDDVLTLLVHLGYLTYDFYTKEVSIPNYEISEQFASTIKVMGWSEVANSLKLSDELLKSTLNCDGEKVAELIDKAHSDNTSILKYNDENSLSCVISLAYYSARKTYTIERELPAGKGFADLVFRPRKNNINPAIIVELKYDKSAEGAIEQIKKKQYADCLKDYSGDILLVGINYNKDTKKHDCVIEKIVK